MTDTDLYSAKRLKAQVKVDEEEEEQCEGWLLSSTPNGASPSQRGRSSLYPTSSSIQNPVYQGLVTLTGISVHFSYTSDLTGFDFHISNPNIRSVCSLLNSVLRLIVFFFCIEIGAPSQGCEPRLMWTLSPDTHRVTIYLLIFFH